MGGMDLGAFYGVVSGINFTLLGLWWVAVREREEIGEANRRMAYLVSLQFVVPGTISLLSQVAPDEPVLWRVSFAAAGIAGMVGVLMLAPLLARVTGQTGIARALQWVAAPAYLIVAAVAAVPGLIDGLDLNLTPLQVEAILLCILVFLGVQAAWVVAMAPKKA